MRRLTQIRRGFSITELIVAIAIMMMLLSVVVVGQRKFANDLDLLNLSYEVAGLIREAQVKAVNVSPDVSIGGGDLGGGLNFDISYGVHITPLTEQFRLFRDLDNDGIWDTGDPTLTLVSLPRGSDIASFCYVEGGQKICLPAAVTVTFTRPSLTASIKRSGGPAISKLEVVLAPITNSGNTKTVVVERSGQIYVE